MDTPVENVLVDAAYSQPETALAQPPETRVEEASTFDLGKAARYSVANLGASVFYGLFNFGMPLYLDTYKLDPSLIGLLANERSFVGAFVQPVVGRLSDRTRSPLGRRRPFFLVGIPLVCVALLLLALHPPFWVMLGIMTVTAFFLAIAWDPYMAMMADIFPPLHRGRVGGLLGVGSGLGNIIFLVLAAILWSTHEFLVFALIVLVLIASWAYTFFTVKEPDPETYEVPEKAPRLSIATYARDLLSYPEMLKYTLAVLFFWLGTGGATPFITLFGTKVLNATTNEAFVLPIGAVVFTVLFAIPAGYLADRLKSKKIVMTIGMLIYGGAGLIGSQSHTLLQGTIALAVVGIGNSALSLINPMLSDIVPRKRMAEFIGIVSAVFSFAQPLGSWLAGRVVDFTIGPLGTAGAYRCTFIFAGVMIILSAILLQTVHPSKAKTD